MQCEYGCGKEATHQFKSSKKWCCSQNVNACDGKRNADSQKKKGINPWAGKEHPKGMLGKKSYNSGKTYVELFGADKAEEMKDNLRETIKIGGKCSDPEKEKQRCQKLSISMKKFGGYRRGSGRGKKGWYKGYWCDSSWELAFVIYNLDHGIEFIRNTEKFSYEFGGKKRNWIPDFKLSDGTFIEIKGYETEQVKAKFAVFPHKIIILKESDIKLYLEYVKSKYGKNFIDLYEVNFYK